ncbi:MULTISPECIES: hypothetical protein [Xenorhabdus]|uniref:hypothetical protein n=1 Tax=Xenorhabdus TaxID=626 RepID=UPI00064AD88E|nr:MULTISPECIES: hypothetical protein [Xenorhabdus]KLU14847.1 hypothetical protein AAY47_13840 [Xenorhabdus griffiniae]KOP32680.1 hypothetical protein AFK69_13945 [Xenorhabdus sp. GDc328]
MPEQRKAAKEDVILPERGTVLRVGAGLWPGLAQKLTAEGASLVRRHLAMPISGGARHNVYYAMRAALPVFGGLRG